MSTAAPTLPTTSWPRAQVREARSAGISGLLSVALMLASFAVLPADPGGQTAEAITARYADGSSGYLTAAVLESMSVGLFCLFTAGVSVWLWARRAGALLPVAAAIGGTVLASGQLAGYALIATLAHSTAGSGDLAVVMALYDLSAISFVAANVGLAVLCAAVGSSLLTGRPRTRALGWFSVVAAILAGAATAAYAPSGAASIHGDLGFVTLLIQLLWTATISVRLLRPATDTQ